MVNVSVDLSEYTLETKIAERIRSFAVLPDGWHYGTGVGAVDAAVNAAHYINLLLADYGARNIEVFPAVDGGIVVSGYHGQDTIEILCHPTGLMDLVHEVDDDIVKERNRVSKNDIEKFLGDLEWLPKNSFVHYTQTISAVKKGVSIALPFNPHLETEEYPSLKQSAPLALVDANVAISIDSTGASFLIPMCSGGSTLISSRKSVESPMSLQQQATRAIGTSADFQISDAGI